MPEISTSRSVRADPPTTERALVEGKMSRSRDGSLFVCLAGLEPVARGGENEVFTRPGKPSQLVKVRRGNQIERMETSRSIKSKLKRWRGIGPYKNLLRQNREYLDAFLRAAELGRPPPLAHPRGVLLTDLGLGIVVQKIRDRDGRLAPSLWRLRKTGGITPEVVAALTQFARDMSAFHIIGYDLHPGNLLYETRHGHSRVVLVDGYGSRNPIPIRRWSRPLNDRSLAKRFTDLAKRLDLVWDARDWSFAARGGAVVAAERSGSQS